MALAVAVVVERPRASWAATGEAGPQFGPLLFAVAMLVLAAKAGGLLAERWRQPPVLGELLVGIVLGNLALTGSPALRHVRGDPTLDSWPRSAC